MNAASAQILERQSILTERDGSPVEIINPDGDSNIVLICEHASNLVPDPSTGGNPIEMTKDNTRALFEAVL